jgi:hypothetical protein
MRVTAAKTVSLTEAELREAVLDWIYSHHSDEYHTMLMEKGFEIDFNGKYFSLMISEEIVEFDSEKR